MEVPQSPLLCPAAHARRARAGESPSSANKMAPCLDRIPHVPSLHERIAPFDKRNLKGSWHK